MLKNDKTSEPLSDYERYKALTAGTQPEAEKSDYERYKAIEGEMIDVEVDYFKQASKAVKPVYENAVNKVNEFFDTTPNINTAAGKKLRLQDKADILDMDVNDLKDADEKSIDKLIFRKRAKEAAVKYPEYVNKADQKSLEQLFNNPKAVNQINNSAKARAMKATTFEKFVATNKAGILSMKNNLEFLAPDGDFDTWAMTHKLVDAERKANSAVTKGTPVLNAMWDKYQPFSDESTVSFVDIAKYITTDAEGFQAAFAEASNSASSIAMSIAGKAVGAGVGALGGPAGMFVGAQTGTFLAAAVASMDEYIQNEIDTNYTDANGNVNYEALRADIPKIKTRWRIEASEQGISGGALEMFAPKIFGKITKTASKVIPTKVFKSSTVKALAKAGKLGTKALVKGGEEFVGEGLSAFAPKTLIDFQNGRLDKNKVIANTKEGLREGTAGLITAGTLAPITTVIESATDKLAQNNKPEVMAKDSAPAPAPKEGKTFDAESKPFNERTPEETASIEYKTEQAETTLELSEALDNDTDAISTVEGMTDQEQVNLIDSANTGSTTTEDGVVILGTPTETIVNGADIETLLGEDVSVLQEILVQERQVELAQAIQAGEDFKFTYGEWVVAANKLKDKHPTINHLPINTETEMTGYEAVSHLSEVLDLLQSQYDSLTAPAVENTPPSTPGISAEITAENKPITLYHGTNTKFDELDYGIGGGMVFFGENEEVANRYANGAGGLRKVLANDEMYVETEKGVRLDWDGKNFTSEDGKIVASEKDVFAAQGWDSNTLGDYNIKPLDARVISKDVDPNGILDATTDEGAKEILRVLKPTNKTIKRLIKAAQEQIANKDGYNNTFSNEFWGISKLPGNREDLKDFTKQMTEALHTGVRFKDDQHMSVAVFDENPAAIGPRKQTGVVKAVTPTGNMNQVTLTLIDGTQHTIDLYDKESALDIQGIADKLSAQFEKALKASGRTSDTVQKASLQGIPVIMRVLVKRAKALGKPISEMAKSISFKSDASHGSAYIGFSGVDPSKVVYGVGRTSQRVSTVAHEFAHAILHFMTQDGPTLEAQKQAGTISPEGTEYLSAIEATLKLLGLKDTSDVDDSSPTTLTNPTTGAIQTRTQSGGILTKRTVSHEKLATTMEVFLKEGNLKTDNMDTEMAQILLYWRSLIPYSDTRVLKASVAAVEGWVHSGEYHQAIDPSDEVSAVFDVMYSVNQQIDKTTVPMFNFSYFPVEILGKGGQMILDKVIASKHTAIAKVFAKVYADSINARTLINTPQAIANMNEDLAKEFGATYSGELVNSLSQLGLRIPESISKSLSNIQELIERYNPDKVPFYRDATLADIEILLESNTDAVDAGDTAEVVVARMVETFDTVKKDVYQKNLEDLGYVTDDKIKQASEEMLAKALPSILNEQFTQLVANHPAEAKELFSAYIKNGKVSSRVANKHVTIAAQNKLDTMSVKDLRIKALIKNVRDASTSVVNNFNQGKYIEALSVKFDELTKSEMLRLAPDVIRKTDKALAALKNYASLDYQYANAGDVHPETLEYLRNVLNSVAAKTPVAFTKIENLDPDLNLFADGLTATMLNDIAGKKLDSVSAIISMGEYATTMARVAAAAMQLEKEGREFVTSELVDSAKIRILESGKVWDMRSKLPQVNSVHEVFSTYFPSEAAYHESIISDVIYDIINGEAQSTNGSSEILERLKVFSKKSLSKKFEPMTLPNSGLKIESRDELISVLLYLGSASGRETLMRTHGLVTVDPITNTAVTKDAELQQDLDDLVTSGQITADDIALTNAIWAEFVPLLKMIQEVYRRDRGIKVGDIKAVPFTVGGQTLTGGYFPISYNEVMKVGEGAKAQSMFYNVFNVKTFTRTKERGGGKKTPVKLGLGTITSYVNMAMREYYIIPPMKLFEAFVNDPEVAEHIKITRPGALADAARIGPNTIETGIINDWVSTVKNQVRSDVDPNTDKVVNWVLRNTSFVFYSMDAISAVTNTVAGLPAAIPYISSNPRLALNVLTWPFTIRRGNKRAHLSHQLKANERQFVQWVLSENTEELYSKMTTTKAFMEKAAMMLQKVSQHVLERIIWNTEYETQISNGAPEHLAIKKADLVTERVLGRYALSNKSIGQKAGIFGRLNNIATQHLFSFKRHFNVEFKRDSPEWRKAYMTGIIIGSALLSTTIALEIQDWATPDRPKEPEEDKEMRMKLQVASEMLPYFLGAYGRILSGLVNQGINSDISISPLEHTLKRTGRGIYNFATTVGTDYEWGARDYADMLGAATMFTGIPFSGIANANDFVTAFRDHDEIAMDRLMEDAERRAYSREFIQEYNPLID